MYTSPNQAPRSFGKAPISTTHQRGKSHHWMHLLTCVLMLLVVAGYLQAGRASLVTGDILATLVLAISCILMMWLMARMIGHEPQY